MDARRVVVIGAGAAGLSAAWRLRASGCEVALLEATDRPGGRAVSAEALGVRFDPTGATLSSADRRALGLVAEAGASARVRALGPGGTAQTHRGRLSRVDDSSRLGVARIPGVRWLDALRLMRLDRLLARYRPHLDPDAPERGATLDDRSLRDFATLYFGRSVAERWIGPFATDGTGNRPDDASRLLFLLRAESHRGATPVTLDGGIGTFLAELADELGVRLRARAREVTARAAGGFEVGVETDAGGEALVADAVVLATPPAVALDLAGAELVSAERDFLGAVTSVPALCLALGFEARPWRTARRIRIPHADGWPLVSLSLLPPEAVLGLPPEGSVAVAAATGEWATRQAGVPDDVVAKDLMGVVARLVPGARREPVFARVTRSNAAMPCFEAGHFRKLARLRRVGDDRREAGRRLYLAGDYLAGPWIEAAVGSGRRAAEALLADLET